MATSNSVRTVFLNSAPPVKRQANGATPTATKKIFYHSGDRGDLVYALPTIKALGGGKLIMGTDLSIGLQTCVREPMSPKTVESFKLMLLTQPYITGVEFSPCLLPEVTHNLNRFREFLVHQQTGDYWSRPAFRGTRSLSQVHLDTFGIERPDETIPWLKADAPWTFREFPLVIHRSQRYHHPLFPWEQILKRYGHLMVFVGGSDEWEALCRIGETKTHFFWPINFMELTRLMAGCRGFVGNQSSPFSVAEGLKINTVQESWMEGPNCTFNRPNGVYETTDWKTISSRIEAWLEGFSDTPPPSLAEMRISFCITAKNRKAHIQKTLAKHFEDNADYQNLEIVLLDYSSSDGLGNMVKRRFGAEIKSNRLVYYAAKGQPYYHSSHAKNCAHRLATGDILVNLDADNFTGEGFARYINDEFSNGADICFSPMPNGSHGRIAVRRETLYKLGGYDESQIGYGWDDNDFKNRAARLGLRAVIMPQKFAKCLPNPDDNSAGYYGSDLKESNLKNQLRFDENVYAGRFEANKGKRWGEILARRNFTQWAET